MKNNSYFLNTLLTCILGLALLICVLVRTFLPGAVLPVLNIPAITGLCLIALVAEFYLAPGTKRCYPVIFLLSAATFGLLPLAAGFGAAGWWKLALIGAIVCTTVTWLYTSMVSRISSGNKAKAAPVLSALGLYLAVQCFMGILL